MLKLSSCSKMKILIDSLICGLINYVKFYNFELKCMIIISEIEM